MANTSRGKIAFDLDHTLVNWPRPVWEIAGELVGVDMTGSMPKKYGLQEFPPSVADMLKRMFLSEFFMCEAVWPTHASVTLLDWLRDQGWDPFVVTARAEPIRGATTRMVESFFGIEQVEFVDPGSAKWPVYAQHKAVAVVEDNPKDLRDAIEMNLQVYTMAASWNVGIPGDRFHSCAAILKHLSDEAMNGKSK